MNRHTDGRSEAGALVPLSRLQTTKLILLAREAWEERRRKDEGGGMKAAEECPFDVPGERTDLSFDEWRHQQCQIAVERPGLSACHNEDYLPLKAHFLRILGREDEADVLDERAAMEPRQRVLREFQRACTVAASALDNPVQYAEGFLRRACHCGIDDASEKNLWRAVYLLRRKAGLERKKMANA